MVPKSLLNELRRGLVARLDELAATVAPRAIASDPVVPALRAAIIADPSEPVPPGPELSVLCRTTEQIEAAVEAGIRTFYADYQHIKLYKDAVAAARRGSAAIFLATPRIEKPGEGNLFRWLERCEADGILVRNAGGMRSCAERGLPFVADFSLNAANELTVQWLKGRGAVRVTASYDLSFDQLDDLL
jgi:putative protease